MAEAGGGTPAGAEAAAERLVAQGATALVSFGLAGLIAGAIVIPAEVMEHGQRYRTTYALCARFGGQMPVRALATDSILATPESKVRAHYDTYAVIVDMESGAVARVAARYGLPFAAVRAVCDPAGFALPPLALEALDAGGRIGPWRVMRSVLRRPGQIPALITLSGHASEARAALARLTSKSRGS
jgi:adenosylhomocysteine nucleosidase